MTNNTAFDKRVYCIDEEIRSPDMENIVKAIEEYFVIIGKLTLSIPVWKIYPTNDWKKFMEAGTFIYQ